MRFAKHPAVWAALLPPLMIGLLTAWYQRPAARQARLDHRLAAALNARDTNTALAALRQGADPNARNYYEIPPTPWVRIIHPAAARADDKARAHDWEPVLITAIRSRAWRPTMTPDQIKADDRVVQALLDKGVDVNKRDSYGYCALSYAAADGSPFLRHLVARGADVNRRERSGGTALIFACINRRETAARILLEQGANTTLRDNRGRTALGEALASRHPDPQIIRLLKAHGAKR